MGRKSQLFDAQTGKWAPVFLFLLPIIYTFLLSFGWTQDDYVEESVYNIWSRSGGAYFQDKEYELDVRGDTALATSSFLAMAVSRDGGNLFTASRLEEVRARMEEAEATTVEYNGNTFTWDDMCFSNNAGLGTTYEFPCLRLSPMDLFQEARWFFDETDRVTWYHEVIRKRLVRPRVPRFGIMQGVCSTLGGATSISNACDETLLLRTNQDFATAQGYPDDYADPLKLFSDISDLELNHPCRVCFETAFEATMERLTAGTKGLFGVMALELNNLFETLSAVPDSDPQDVAAVGALLQKAGKIAQEVDREAVEEFYTYYVTRTLYAQLGATSYVENYANVMASPLGQACVAAYGGDVSKCPPTVSEAEAQVALTRHADNIFSSITTAGSPFPFWSSGDGTGAMFAGTSPVSGSGIDLTGTILSGIVYFDATNYRQPDWNPLYVGFPDPLTPDAGWAAAVETDPIYKWFMAGETPMVAECGNGNLTGTNTSIPALDGPTAAAAAGLLTQRWCTKFNTVEEGEATQQAFAKMFYDLVIDSPGFLGIVQGESDPYIWTSGQGCGYELKGERDPYTEQSDASILQNASRELYYIDEGVSVGALDRNLLIGEAIPSVQEYNATNPLQSVGVIQSIYVTGTTRDLVDRVKNCNRPGGAVEITEEDAEEILKLWKEGMVDRWSRDWNKDDVGEVQFVGFYDDQGGAPGTFSRLLGDITLDNGKLMAISIVLIAVVSCVFLFSCDFVESRVLVTLAGVALVIISFFAAIGFCILIGIKININIAWSLPFIIIGLGVDDMYIVLLALKARAGYTKRDFIAGMKDVIVPVSMTSIVNASMFAVMNISDIQAIYKTAQAALISVIFLYLTVIFCFPAYCYQDMKRQLKNHYDVLFCLKRKQKITRPKESEDRIEGGGEEEEEEAPKTRFQNIAEHYPEDTTTILYDKVYHPLVFGDNLLPKVNRIFIWIATFVLVGVGIWGITERRLGLGVEEFFPSDHQANVWATTRSESLASWSVLVNWGALDYKDPDEQMRMIKQFEDVVATPHIAETDTKQLWMADLAVWTTRQCAENFDRDDPDVRECGSDQVFPGDNTTCRGTWKENKYGLRQKSFDDPRSETCNPFEGGICRPADQMHPGDVLELQIDVADGQVFCPVFEGWSDEKLQFCVEQWRKNTGGGGNLVVEEDTATPYEECEGDFYNDDEVRVPIPLSQSPSMFAYDLFSHEDTVDMIAETRSVCDENEDLHCWMTGIPFDYWEQYLWVENLLLEIAGICLAVGFGVSGIFLFSQLYSEGQHGKGKIAKASLVGALLIVTSCAITLVVVVGLSSLFDVNWTAFGMMSFVLSVGFSVEYSCHVVHRFLSAPQYYNNSKKRVDYTMKFLTLPLTLSFISSTIGVACLAFTDFEFNNVYFFRPLIIVMFVSYFVGCWFLPVALMVMDCDFLKVGPKTSASVFHAGEKGASGEGDETANAAATATAEAVASGIVSEELGDENDDKASVEDDPRATERAGDVEDSKDVEDHAGVVDGIIEDEDVTEVFEA